MERCQDCFDSDYFQLRVQFACIFALDLPILDQVVYFRNFPGGPVDKNLPSNAGTMGSIPSLVTKIPHAPG